MIDRIEALADAIADLNGWGDPCSQAYQLRNPLLLRAFSLSRMQKQDEEGYRVFQSGVDGYKAGRHDLALKVSGVSRSGLGVDSTLRDLLASYKLQHVIAVKRCVQFLERALACSDGSIHDRMQIGWFLEASANAPLAPLKGESFVQRV